MVPRAPGVAVELHVALSPPGTMSMQLGWDQLVQYTRLIEGPAGPARAFNLTGTALHRAIHGAGVVRLHDIVLLARALRADPLLPQTLAAIFADEQNHAVAIDAAIVFAARMAGVRSACDADVERYLQWAVEREGLPPEIRMRSQFIDAWYLDRRSAGPHVRRAFMPWQTVPTARERVVSMVRACGRLALALAYIPFAHAVSRRSAAQGGLTPSNAEAYASAT